MDDPPRPDRVAGTCAEAFRRAGAGDVRGALRAARQAVLECDDAQSRLALGGALVRAGRGGGAYALFRAGGAPPPAGAVPPLGEVALWMEDYDTARRDP